MPEVMQALLYENLFVWRAWLVWVVPDASYQVLLMLPASAPTNGSFRPHWKKVLFRNAYIEYAITQVGTKPQWHKAYQERYRGFLLNILSSKWGLISSEVGAYIP